MTWSVETTDCLSGLRGLPDGSLHVQLCSPPYWGLRDYSVAPLVWGGDDDCEHEFEPTPVMNGSGDGQSRRRDKKGYMKRGGLQPGFCRCGAWCGDLGLEPTPELYIEHLVQIFREVRRVLRDDGTCWVNLGDSYAAGGQNAGSTPEQLTPKQRSNAGCRFVARKAPPGMKPKDLCGIPFMFALAMRNDDWYWRSTLPWCKRSAMPDSASDRPGSAVEYVFLFSKSRRYYFDMEAVRRAPSGIGGGAAFGKVQLDGPGSRRCEASDRERYAETGRGWRNGDLWFESITAPHGLVSADDELLGFDVNPEGFKEAHFATWPTKLVAPMLAASTSAKGVCAECGAPWRRVIESEYYNTDSPTGESWKGNGAKSEAAGGAKGKVDVKPGDGSWTYQERTRRLSSTIGWEPSCNCECAEIEPALACDIFSGAGTTGLVAKQMGLRYLGFELNDGYAEMSRRRISSNGKSPVTQPASQAGQRSLWEDEG